MLDAWGQNREGATESFVVAYGGRVEMVH